jgi:hypothetical protein
VAAIAGRGEFSDLVIGFSLLNEQGQDNTNFGTNPSYVVFLFQALNFLRPKGDASPSIHIPGSVVRFRLPQQAKQARIQSPSGKKRIITPTEGQEWVFNETDERGIYQVLDDSTGEVLRRFIVQSFSQNESRLQRIVPRNQP